MGKISAVSDPAKVARLLSQYAQATKSWELSAKEHAALLDVPTATFSRIRNGSYRGRLGQDKLMRIRYLTAINLVLYKSNLHPNWLLAYNALPEYNGTSPLDKMLEGGIVGMDDVLKALIKTGQG